MNNGGNDYNAASGEVTKDTYHLEIDAETGREGLPPENIKIYRVDAPDVSKRAQQGRSKPSAPA
jgi:hypothetical protein